MRDYDKLREELDTDFRIRGHEFKMHPMSLAFIGIWVEREEKVDKKDQVAFQQMCIDRIADAVDDGNGAAERWRELAASEQGPSYGELLELSRWVWEVQADLPTMGSDPSGSGPGTTAVSSRAG